MVSILYVFLAIIGLSFLVFIHELGHYWMAKRVGMKVETFSIGFGRPIISWATTEGVTWQIGWILFGGYVRIKGMDTDKEGDPYAVPDGFFGKSPWDRIKVAFMGPFVNILFAILAFGLLWSFGGREKNFAEYTGRIGWVDPASELYEMGVRPGDEITSYDGNEFLGAKDHIYAPMISSGQIIVEGNKINHETLEKRPFSYTVSTYPNPNAMDKGISTAGILAPAGYVIYDRFSNEKENPLPEGSPMIGSGISYGDRVVWAGGLPVFSQAQLSYILNDGRTLLTIERNGKHILRRVPRVEVQELKLDNEVREELIDWQFEAKLNAVKIQQLFYIPYNLTDDCQVENEVRLIDTEKEDEAFPRYYYGAVEEPLEPGDRIIAVDGIPVERSYRLLKQLQENRVNVIVDREPKRETVLPYLEMDAKFDEDVDWKSLNEIAASIGTRSPVRSLKNLHLLNPVTPKSIYDFELTPEKQSLINTELMKKKNEIEQIEDPEQRHQLMRQFESRQNQLLLGLPAVQDQRVLYNPGPIELFGNVFNEITRTLGALATGSLNPKWISGPIGIVQVVHSTATTGIRESLFWLGAISLNLGILNLLPIPVLDGGTILLSLVEMITRRKINPKTLERIVIPFAILLITFFVFLTYNDLSRIFGGLFSW